MRVKPRILPTAFAAAAMLAPCALAQSGGERPTPREFRDWTNNGRAYGWTCTVLTSAGAPIRSKMGGAVRGRLARGTEFVPGTAASDQKRRTWYLADFIYRNPLTGWVSAADVTCRAEHFG